LNRSRSLSKREEEAKASSFLVPNGSRDRTHPNATVRWTVAHARLDGHATIIFAPRAKMQIDPGHYLKGKRRQNLLFLFQIYAKNAKILTFREKGL
jgi:hypothetical protein